MQLIGFAILWKTAFPLKGLCYFRAMCVSSSQVSPSTGWPRARAILLPARSCNAARSISMYLSHVPRGTADLSHSYTGTSLRPSSRLDYPISTRAPRRCGLGNLAWRCLDRGARDGRAARISTPLIPFWRMPLSRLACMFPAKSQPRIGAKIMADYVPQQGFGPHSVRRPVGNTYRRLVAEEGEVLCN